MARTGVERGRENGASAAMRKPIAGEGDDIFHKVQTLGARGGPGNFSGTAQGETRIHQAIPNLPPPHIWLPVAVGTGAEPSSLPAKQRSRGSAGTVGLKMPDPPAAAHGKRSYSYGAPGYWVTHGPPHGPFPGGCLSISSRGGRSIRLDLHGNPHRAAGKALI